MDHDWKSLMWAQSVALADLIDELPDEQLNHDTLCEGWQVRDIYGHMLVGHTTPMAKMLGLIVKYKFNVPKGSFEMSKAKVADMAPADIRSQWRTVAEEHTRNGISKTISYKEGFLDHFIHEQDIRRPLAKPRGTDADTLTAALDAVVAVKGPMFAPAKSVSDLHLEATDVDWSHGEGRTVRGPAEALIMAAAGRASALAELEGDGIDTLTARIS